MSGAEQGGAEAVAVTVVAGGGGGRNSANMDTPMDVTLVGDGGGGGIGGGTTATSTATSTGPEVAVPEPVPAVEGVGAAAGGVVPTDVLEERLIDEEYKIWKKNTPFLYDYVMTHSLEWPSLTCQWLPRRNAHHAYSSDGNNKSNNKSNNSNNNNSATEEHSLLIGTHTTGEQNYLMVASCTLPRQQHLAQEGEQQQQDTKNNSSNKMRSRKGSGTAPSSSSNHNTATTITTTAPAPEYDEEKGEMGGFGIAPDSSVVGKITIQHKILHEGEVNRARYMPQNPFVIASRGPNPQVYIWDRTKHSSIPTTANNNNDPAIFAPQGVCVGHTREGYGMVWSAFDAGHLATASEDKTVRIWDVSHVVPTGDSGTSYNQGKKYCAGHQIHPLTVLRGHTDTVEDVDWHLKDPNLLVSVGGDRKICLWDKANPKQPHFVVKDAHLADINSVAFNPGNEHVLATGSSDKTIGIWDVRRLNSKVHSLENVHVDDVFSIQWAPFDEAILASCSADRRVVIWDLARVGQEQSPEDAQDGPPELLFLHGGHTSKVSDLAWNPDAPWTLASTSEDNIFQIWSMAEEIHSSSSLTGWANDDDDDDDEEDNYGTTKLGRHELE